MTKNIDFFKSSEMNLIKMNVNVLKSSKILSKSNYEPDFFIYISPFEKSDKKMSSSGNYLN